MALAVYGVHAEALPMNDLQKLSAEGITVYYTKRTDPSLMQRLADTTVKSSVFLSALFGCATNFAYTIYWLPEPEWKQKFGKRTYGFPALDALPAIDVDFPEPLARITELIDFKSLTDEQVSDLSRMLKIAGKGTRTEIEKQFKTSKNLYTDFCIDFTLPHEIAHNCWHKLYAVNGSTYCRPYWANEFAAQVAGIVTLREFGMDEQAEFYSLFYRLMYSGGRAKVKYPDLRCEDEGRGGDLFNHAWLHGADLQMLWELEQKFGKAIGRKFIRLLGEALKGLKTKDAIMPDAEIIQIMSNAAGEDLKDWFAKWGIVPGQKK